MASRQLIIDLSLCDQCRSGTVSPAHHVGAGSTESTERQDTACSVDCSAIVALREKATFELICRRCEHASCIVACPFDALERTSNGVIKRHNLRCVSCKSCAIACPFGTIYMELLPFYSLDYESSCRICLAGLSGDASQKDSPPECVVNCSHGALQYRERGPDEAGIHCVDEYLAVRTGPRARAWSRTEAAP